MADKKPTPPDSGSQSLDHYKRRLPKWRLAIRELLIPIVRFETPYIDKLQQIFSTPARDSYFAYTANLGTHTFFMLMLPIMYWCGHIVLARAFVQMLAAGVFWSGYIKDLVCLPRPLSPPVKRISRSASAVLEYGFPSTHTTNAVSVAAYSIYALRKSSHDGWLNFVLQCLTYAYALSILIGRVYCGMHGFFDVIVGALLGGLIAVVQCTFGDSFDAWIHDDVVKNVLLYTLVVLFLVRVHPEPADDCPCFDDSVAFTGVIIGIQLGAWHFMHSGFAVDTQLPSSIPFSLRQLGLARTTLRLVFGVFMVFVWRGLMKPILLKTLPPVFRVIEQLGLSLPRKFFLRASQYRSVPPLRKDDTVIPSAFEIPAMLGSLRHPRKRAISIGPQSEADAYEAIAFRDRKRRESLTMAGGSTNQNGSSTANDYSHVSATGGAPAVVVTAPQPDYSYLNSSPALLTPTDASKTIEFPTLQEMKIEDDKEDRAMFAKLQKPRVRYDVEVVTKLVIYAGIGIIATDVGPIVFELCGLGLGVRP